MKRKPVCLVVPMPSGAERRSSAAAEGGEAAARDGGSGRKKWPLPRRQVCQPRQVLEPECERRADFLQWLLGKKGWTLDELAGVTHLDRSYLGDLVTGRQRNPTLDVVARLAKAFGLGLRKFAGKLVLLSQPGAALMPDPA